MNKMWLSGGSNLKKDDHYRFMISKYILHFLNRLMEPLTCKCCSVVTQWPPTVRRVMRSCLCGRCLFPSGSSSKSLTVCKKLQNYRQQRAMLPIPKLTQHQVMTNLPSQLWCPLQDLLSPQDTSPPSPPSTPILWSLELKERSVTFQNYRTFPMHSMNIHSMGLCAPWD